MGGRVMHRKAVAFMVAAALGLGLGLTGTVQADSDWGAYAVGDVRSGYTYAKPATQDIQNDDFENPGFIWVDYGAELWEVKEGAAGKACANCHEDAETTMKGVGASYPVYSEELGKPINLEQRINKCRVDNMQAKPWKWESRELLSMTTFVRHQSRGMPVNVKVDGPLKAFYDKGKEFFYKRRGQLDMACANCHEDNAGNMIRANLLSQGQSNGFPTYRLKWQGIGSLHRRFRGCNKQVRAAPFANGSDEYVNLELYLADRGRQLPVETPSVRN